MKKRFLRCFSVPAALFCMTVLSPFQAAFPVSAEGEAEEKVYNGMVYEISEDGTSVTIMYCTDDLPAELVIPSEIDGLPVTGFSQMAFYNRENLTSVTIPETVTSFGMQTFLSCKNLKTVNLPAGLTSIDEGAFAMCTSLESITLPDGLKEIGNLVFSGCTALKEINIPASVDTFGEPAFGETPWLEAKKAENPLVVVNDILLCCDGTEHVTVPEGVKAIAPYAFGWESKSPLTEIDLPDSLTRLMYVAFAYCPNLKTIHYSENLTDIERFAFDGTAWLDDRRAEDPFVVVNGVLVDATTLTGDVTIPDTVKIIGEGAFWGFSEEGGVTDVVIPDSVTEIRANAFYDCEKLEKVTLPETVRTIEKNVFENCKSLTEITLPKSVREIGRTAFYGCEALREITILNPNCSIYDSFDTIASGMDFDTWTTYFNGEIVGYDNSSAQRYAEKYSYQFRSLGGAPAVEYDFNSDSAFDISDAVVFAKYLSESLAPEEVPADALLDTSDLDGNGLLTLQDLRLLLQKLA
ncbi:MAG: leucine-rich repeat domain-containing protein [Oscillospiraceae bacterium]|nr:leucine-rich repeat domain-containing protein [Oscillospiraceae bacterium]